MGVSGRKKSLWIRGRDGDAFESEMAGVVFVIVDGVPVEMVATESSLSGSDSVGSERVCAVEKAFASEDCSPQNPAQPHTLP